MDITNYLNDIDTNTNMDETEDEEVKRNCFGMKHYESSSDESEDEDESGDLGSPIKFRCGNPSGRGVLKPTPMTLQRVLENKIVQPKKQAHQIIHNECEFSDDEGAFSDEQSCASVNDPPFPEVNKEVNYENADDSASEATEEISEDEGEDGHEDTSFVDETSNHDEDSLQSDLSSYSGDHSSCSDADDESSDDEEIEEDQEEAKVIVDWGEIAAEDLVSKVSSSVTEDNDSVSADEIEDFIGKPETSDMCFSDTEVTEDDYDVMSCLIDAEGDDTIKSTHPLKRVLSVQRVEDGNEEDEGSQCKRSRTIEHTTTQECDGNNPPFFPIVFLKGTAYSKNLMHRQRDSPQFSASTQEEAVDYQLAEELIDNMMCDEAPETSDPVPLLTRPSTPVVESLSSSGQVVCEWPSNLAVDNALTAAISLRPLSPSSLSKLEENDDLLATPTTYPQKRLRSVSEVSSTAGLTPMLSSMNMPKG